MKIAAVLVLFSFFLSSCTITRLLSVYRAGEPNETELEVQSFLVQKKFRYDYSLMMDDSLVDLLTTPRYRINHLEDDKFSVIQLRIYDSLGLLYSAYSQCMGDFEDKQLLQSFPPLKNNYPYLNHLLYFDNELNVLLADDRLKCELKEESTNHKYTYVVYYTMWTQYFSRRVLKAVSRLKKQHDDDILVLFVNVAYEKTV